MCGKKNYTTWKHAAFDARELRRKRNEPEKPYYCRKCQAWHVGADYVRKMRRKNIA